MNINNLDEMIHIEKIRRNRQGRTNAFRKGASAEHGSSRHDHLLCDGLEQE
jgi:hypothetical protein